MNLKSEFQPIRNWAAQRGIYTHGDSKTQFVKLLEEVGELSHGILKEDKEEIKDAIGDVVVVLTSIAHMSKLEIEECINHAYIEISQRKGKMVNGSFVKQQ